VRILRQEMADTRPNVSTSMEAATDKIDVLVAPFTGGPFSVQVSRKDSVEELKKLVAKKLKVLKDRICLLYRDSQLSEGSLEDNCIVDGSRITLLPRAETGLLVSLDSRVRDIINRNMIAPSQHTFDEAQLQIYTLMHRDSYPRFVNSSTYKNMLRTVGVELESSESSAS